MGWSFGPLGVARGIKGKGPGDLCPTMATFRFDKKKSEYIEQIHNQDT